MRMNCCECDVLCEGAEQRPGSGVHGRRHLHVLRYTGFPRAKGDLDATGKSWGILYPVERILHRVLATVESTVQ